MKTKFDKLDAGGLWKIKGDANKPSSKNLDDDMSDVEKLGPVTGARETMNADEFFAEAKRLNLRILGTPEEIRAALDANDAEIETLRSQLAHWKTFAVHAEGEHAAWKKTATELDEELRALKEAAVDGRTYTQADLLEAVKTERHACGIAVWMTLQDALATDADDKGLDGWLREAEDRVKRRA